MNQYVPGLITNIALVYRLGSAPDRIPGALPGYLELDLTYLTYLAYRLGSASDCIPGALPDYPELELIEYHRTHKHPTRVM